MSSVGTIHLVFSLLAIVLGGTTLSLPKGTRWHRTWGHGYVWAMAGVIGTSLAMYDLTGRITPFHVAALVAAATIAAGMWNVLARGPTGGCIEAHATWMAWSYVGLIAAFVAESLTRFAMPLLQETLERNALWPAFWILVGVGSFAAAGTGGWIIRRKLGPSVDNARRLMRGDRREVA